MLQTQTAAMNSDQFKAPRSLTPKEEEMLQKQKEMTNFKKNKLEVDACKNWQTFYRLNQSHFFKDRHWSRQEFEDIFNDMDLTGNMTFLEVGCGVGNMLFPLLNYFNNWDFFGFDFSSRAIEQLRARAKEDCVNITAKVLDITTGDRESIGFPQADIATLIYVLSAIHPDNFDKTLQNLATFIRSGGFVFIRDYGVTDHAMIRFGREKKISDRFYARQDGTRAYYFYVEELQSLFERHGFRTSSCEYLFKKTTNFKKELSVDRVFVQGRFQKM